MKMDDFDTDTDRDLKFKKKIQSDIVLIVTRGGRGSDLKKCPNLN